VSGKASTWTAEREAWLIAAIREHVLTTGRVHWQRLTLSGVTLTAMRSHYSRLVQQGRALPLTALRRAWEDGDAPPETPTPPTPPPAPTVEQEVETETTEKGVWAKSFGSRIKTVDDLLRHIDADMTRFEVAKAKAKKHEGQSKNADGDAVVTEMFGVEVELKPKAGPNTQELVGAMIDAAFAKRRPLVRRNVLPLSKSPLLEVQIIPEPHIGKFAWNEETGYGDYDIGIGCDLLRFCGADLAAKGKHRKPARRTLAVIGDFYHYDTPNGQTTKGTPLDRDGRVMKMIDQGAQALFDMIETSAETAPTDVLLTPGNHDEVLTWALQRILLSHYRNDKRVTVNAEYRSRKYQRWGKTLLGFTHGNKPAKKLLPALMNAECREIISEISYREIHTGHTHAEDQIHMIDGVVVRTCDSIGAADKYHYEEGYVHSNRTMRSWFYSDRGSLEAMESSNPMVDAPTVKRGKAKTA
jgi:hypothetical protein